LPVAWSANVKIEDWNREILTSLAQKYNVSTNQLCYRYGLQKGWSVLARSKNPEHIKSNFDIMNFEISAEDMAKLDNLNSHPSMHIQHPDVMFGVYSYIERLNSYETIRKEKFLLFGFIPLLSCKPAHSKGFAGSRTDFLNSIPIFRTKVKDTNNIKVYLFSFIPIGKIESKIYTTKFEAIPKYEGRN